MTTVSEVHGPVSATLLNDDWDYELADDDPENPFPCLRRPQHMTDEDRYADYLHHQGVPQMGRAPSEDQTNPKDRIGVLKPQLHLVPAALDIYAAEAFRDGAVKYGPFNWRDKDVRASIYVSAIRRHLAAWFDREDVADDSGVHHLAHAAASLAIVIDALESGHLVDDRPTPGPAADLVRRLTRERVA